MTAMPIRPPHKWSSDGNAAAGRDDPPAAGHDVIEEFFDREPASTVRNWRELLPAKDAPYSYSDLSEAETNALTGALGDGFGQVQRGEPLPIPKNIKSGLLEHSFFYGNMSEYDPDEGRDDEFWTSANKDDAPSPYEWCPLGFNPKRLQLYFQNQFERFYEHMVRDDQIWTSLDRSQDGWLFEERASRLLYEKPWYEYHALQFLEWMASKDLQRHQGLQLSFISNVAGQLGRLVEQYYWRFRFEGAAITGVGARNGASAGGRAKAGRHEAEQARWQHGASEAWKRRPGLSKIAVANLIRKQLGAVRTAKHIARYIAKPFR